LLAISTLVTLTAWQYRQKGTTVIPFYWWIIFVSLVFACQVIIFFIK